MAKQKSTRLERNGVLYSIPVYGYIDPLLKEDMDEIRELNPHHSHSQMVQDALAAYVPQLKERMQSRFHKPVQGVSGRRRRRAA